MATGYDPLGEDEPEPELARTPWASVQQRFLRPTQLAQQQKLERAHKKLRGLEQKQQEKQVLWERGDLSKQEYNVLCKDITRQRKNLQAKINKLEVETAGAEVDDAGRSVVAVETYRLKTTRMGLLEVLKKYAIQAMALVASLRGLAGMGPEKLRRVFLGRGGVVVVEEAALVMQVIANPFPSQAIQRAYARLCWELNKRETRFKREGKEYTLTFTWLEEWERVDPNHPI